MYYLVLLLAAAALLGGGRTSNVNRHLKLLAEMDNHIETNELPIPSERLAALASRPPALSARRAGVRLELTCDALAAPAPSIHWYKDDAPVYQHDQESTELIDTSPSSLARISSTLLVPAANATYTCVVVAGSKATRSSSIVVSSEATPEPSERSRLVPLSPRILVQYKVYIDVEGRRVALPCRARAHPRPRISWIDSNGTRIDNSPRMKVLRSGELVIRSVRWTDMGEYTCRATNVFGSDTAKTFLYPASPSETNG